MSNKMDNQWIIALSITIIYFYFFCDEKSNWMVSKFSLTPKKSMTFPGLLEFHDISRLTRILGRVAALILLNIFVAYEFECSNYDYRFLENLNL